MDLISTCAVYAVHQACEGVAVTKQAPGCPAMQCTISPVGRSTPLRTSLRQQQQAIGFSEIFHSIRHLESCGSQWLP